LAAGKHGNRDSDAQEKIGANRIVNRYRGRESLRIFSFFSEMPLRFFSGGTSYGYNPAAKGCSPARHCAEQLKNYYP